MGGKERRGRRDKLEYVKDHVNGDRCYTALKWESCRWSNQASKSRHRCNRCVMGVVYIFNSDQVGHLDCGIFLPSHDDSFIGG